MPGLKTVFWGWDKPLLANAVAWLTRDWDQRAALDLSGTLIVVPTAESARRLREALAAAAAQRGTACMAPWVWHPVQCLAPDKGGPQAASPHQLLLAWAKTLDKTNLGALSNLFPALPEQASSAWSLDTARLLCDLEIELGAGGLSMADVAASPKAAVDRSRWEELAALERTRDGILRAAGLASFQAARKSGALDPSLPPEIQTVAVIGVADPPPLLGLWLERLSHAIEITVCVQAPQERAVEFSQYGSPLATAWNPDGGLVAPIGNDRIHREHNAEAQAALAAELLAQAAPSAPTAIGVCDAETARHLRDRLTLEGARVYEPDGGQAGQHGLVHLASQWRELMVTDSWRAFAALLRVPDFRDALLASKTSGAALLREADDFAAACLPVTLEHATGLLRRDEHLLLAAACKSVRDLAREFHSSPAPSALRGLLLRLYGDRVFRPDSVEDRELAALANAWIQEADALDAAAGALGFALSPTDAMALTVRKLEEERFNDPRGDIDLVLQGWLELLWEPAPHLVVLGCNEENLPGILTSHPFLPDHLREELGLPCQATRYARDAYLLTAAAQMRGGSSASLHLICGRWSDQGDALRPSRLLFLCGDEDLVGRIDHLFPKDETEPATREPPRQISWQLQPRIVTREETVAPTISPSRLRDYLSCPFRYYLKHELRMQSVDAAQGELSAGQFGELIHAAFKALADETNLADCEDEDELADFLGNKAQAQAREWFGKRLPLPVQVQLSSAVQRLKAAATFEAERRRAGWRTLHGEFALGDPANERALRIGSRILRGKIDRIDQHPDGSVLILDFKTRDAATSPLEAHTRSPWRDVDPNADEWKTLTGPDGKRRIWRDLQLPLYARAWTLLHPGQVRVGYFQLPAGVQGTAVMEWEKFDEEMMDSAVACAREAVARMDAGIFWPPAERIEHEDFEFLFAGAAATDAADGATLMNLRAPS